MPPHPAKHAARAHLQHDTRHAEHGPAAVHPLGLSKVGEALGVGSQAQGVEAKVAGQLGVLQLRQAGGGARPGGGTG